jgi:hypothetical protein
VPAVVMLVDAARQVASVQLVLPPPPPPATIIGWVGLARPTQAAAAAALAPALPSDHGALLADRCAGSPPARVKCCDARARPLGGAALGAVGIDGDRATPAGTSKSGCRRCGRRAGVQVMVPPVAVGR